MCGWGCEGRTVRVPVNKENEAKGTVVREEVRFDREFLHIFSLLGDFWKVGGGLLVVVRMQANGFGRIFEGHQEGL